MLSPKLLLHLVPFEERLPTDPLAYVEYRHWDEDIYSTKIRDPRCTRKHALMTTESASFMTDFTP